jgi:TatD DNase family protein
LNRREVSQPFIVDTHCHLDYIEVGLYGHDAQRPLAEVIEAAHQHGVQYMVNPSVNIADFDRVLSVAERFETVYASIGVHPCEVEETRSVPHWQQQVLQRLSHPKVVAIGETGLDYYHQTADSSQAVLQRQCFAQHLEWAVEHGLPLIIHDREAHEDVAKMVDDYPTATGIMHCFGGNADFALAMVERGYMISFAGNTTFKKAVELHEAAKAIPLSAMLLETDSPFLSPVPERGRPNEPYRTRFVAEFIAELRGIPFEELIQQTTKNAFRVFGFPVHTEGTIGVSVL